MDKLFTRLLFGLIILALLSFPFALYVSNKKTNDCEAIGGTYKVIVENGGGKFDIYGCVNK